MRGKNLILTGLWAVSFFSLKIQQVEARTILLNGHDISSARNQYLKNVDIHINEKGEVFIIAPHYEVKEEETFLPLGAANKPKSQEPKDQKILIEEDKELKKEAMRDEPNNAPKSEAPIPSPAAKN